MGVDPTNVLVVFVFSKLPPLPNNLSVVCVQLLLLLWNIFHHFKHSNISGGKIYKIKMRISSITNHNPSMNSLKGLQCNQPSFLLIVLCFEQALL